MKPLQSGSATSTSTSSSAHSTLSTWHNNNFDDYKKTPGAPQSKLLQRPLTSGLRSHGNNITCDAQKREEHTYNKTKSIAFQTEQERNDTSTANRHRPTIMKKTRAALNIANLSSYTSTKKTT